jgi:hypothetical protein
MLWPEKVLILAVIAVIVFLLYMSVALVPIHDGEALVGPVLLPPCGFRISTGVPCPTCYMTRSFALMARGRVLEAIFLQPMGAFLWLGGALLLPVLGWLLVRRTSMWPLLERVRWRLVMLVLFLMTIGAWGYTMARDLALH